MSEARSGWRYAARVGLAIALAAAPARAQSTLEYSRRVDSLAKIWRAAVSVAARDTVRANRFPADSVRVGPIVVRADSAWSSLGGATAARLAAVTTAVYGDFADRLARHQFVLRGKVGADSSSSVVSGIADSAGSVRLLSSDYATQTALFNSWERKAELVIEGEMGPDIRTWIRAVIPIDAPTGDTWSTARVSLVLSRTPAAADCVRGAINRCSEVLGITDVSDPAFVLFDAKSRRSLIEGNATILRRADPGKFDRCTVAKIEAVCDSLARSIPPDAVPAPVAPAVRQSFVRFALMRGGKGAFDRFMVENSPRARIEAAAQIPAESVVEQWRATIMDSRRSSTAVDLETGISALAWAAVCGALALRSSRWR